MSKRPWQLPEFRVRRAVQPRELRQTIPWGLVTNGVTELHERTQGLGTKIAVLDTGIDAAHPDLVERIHARRDFTGSGWGSDDRQGHGTHTAGTIAAENNGQGVIGVAPLAKLLVGKVLGDNGTGRLEDVAAGIQWALDEGADVINLSLGTPDEDEEVLRVFEEAAKRGVYIVCAAGNTGHLVDRAGRDLNTVDYPGRWTHLCVCVGAHDQAGRVAEFSSRGPEVDLLAPGVDVPSCYPGNRYAYMDGTSMATPFVAGLVALIVADRRARQLPAIASQAELEAVLHHSAIPIDAFGTGRGVLSCEGLFDRIPLAAKPEPLPAAPPLAPPALDPIQLSAVLGEVDGRRVRVTLDLEPPPSGA